MGARWGRFLVRTDMLGLWLVLTLGLGLHCQGIAQEVLTEGASQQPLLLTLAGAIELALQNDEELEKARARIDGAEATLAETKSQRYPHVGLAGRYTRNLKIPAFFVNMDGRLQKLEIGADNEFFGTATASWNVWTAGRISNSVGAAQEAILATEFQEYAVANLVRFNTKSAYYTALLAVEQEKIVALSQLLTI